MDQIVFWILWSSVMGVIIWVYNKTLKEDDKLSKEEIQSLMREKFPKIYVFYHGAIVLLSIVGSWIVGGFLIYFWLMNSIHLSKGQVLYFYISDFSFLIFSFYFVLLGMFLGIGIALSKIATIHPKFGRFVKREQLRNLPEPPLNKPDYKQDYRQAWIALIVLLVIGTPILILASDNYTYVKNDGIYYSDFFSLGEKHVAFNEIIKVKIFGWQDDYREMISYKVVLADGTEILLWKAILSEPLEIIDERIRENNISREISGNVPQSMQ